MRTSAGKTRTPLGLTPALMVHQVGGNILWRPGAGTVVGGEEGGLRHILSLREEPGWNLVQHLGLYSLLLLGLWGSGGNVGRIGATG